MALPSGYRRLKCLRSTGTQYIDTGVKPKNTTRVVVNFRFLKETSSFQGVFGSRTSSSATDRFCFYLSNSATFRSDFYNNNQSFNTGISTTEKHTVDKNKNVTTIDGAHSVTHTDGTFTGTNNLYLFGNSTKGSLTECGSVEIYSGKIYDDGTLVRNYVPALRASDSKPGMYDEANDVFYTNAGTGEFEYEEVEPTGDHRTMVDAVIWGVPSGRCLVDGVGYSIQKGRTLVDGVGYDVAFGPSGTPAGDIAVGSSVYANVNGVRKEFLVVHQGIPSSLYDASCDGTWLLMKDLYETRKWHSSNVANYKASTAHSYLNGTFLNLIDTATRSRIKSVKIPYVNGTGRNAPIETGANGLSANVFLLSGYEVGFLRSWNTYIPVDGAKLGYFGSAQVDSTRIAYLNGTAINWWLRSTCTFDTTTAWTVWKDGSYGDQECSTAQGVRPAFVLDSSAVIDPNTFDILG